MAEHILLFSLHGTPLSYHLHLALLQPLLDSLTPPHPSTTTTLCYRGVGRGRGNKYKTPQLFEAPAFVTLLRTAGDGAAAGVSVAPTTVQTAA